MEKNGILEHHHIFRLEESTNPNNKIKTRDYTCWSKSYDQGTHCENAMYNILNYDNTAFCFDEPMKHRQNRSVIMSHPEKLLLSFSPPKSLCLDEFRKQNVEPYASEDIYVNELMEGVLIHLFFDVRINQWEIATKRAVGGVYHLFNYKNREIKKELSKVRDLFLDAICIPRKTPFGNIHLFDSLSKDYSYCFILQHPENPIILPIVKPAIYLISVYSILSFTKWAILIPPPVYESWTCFKDIPVIQFPAKYLKLTYSDHMSHFSKTSEYSSMGIVITNTKTGEHCVIHNPMYNKMIKFANNSLLQYQYLSLFRIGKVSDFLVSFPKYKNDFHAFYQEFMNFVSSVHRYYIHTFVEKRGDKIPEKYECYVNFIHKEIYLNQRRIKSAPADLTSSWSMTDKEMNTAPEGRFQIFSGLKRGPGKRAKITREVVIDYFNKKTPDELLYILSYDRRLFTVRGEPLSTK